MVTEGSNLQENKMFAIRYKAKDGSEEGFLNRHCQHDTEPYFWKSQKTAENVLKTHESGKKNAGYTYQCVEITENTSDKSDLSKTNDSAVPTDNTSSSAEIAENDDTKNHKPELPSLDDMIKLCTDLSSLTENIDDYISQCEKIVKKEDWIVIDLLHVIELQKCSAAKIMQIHKALKESRIRRREAKDRLRLLTELKQAITSDSGKKICEAVNSLYDREYHPRELEDLSEK